MWSFFLDALTVPRPSHPPCYFGCHFFFPVFRPFDVSLWFLSDHLTCGYVLPPQLVFSFTALMYSTNPSVVGIYKNNS